MIIHKVAIHLREQFCSKLDAKRIHRRENIMELRPNILNNYTEREVARLSLHHGHQQHANTLTYAPHHTDQQGFLMFLIHNILQCIPAQLFNADRIPPCGSALAATCCKETGCQRLPT